jgi:hypothetical protein
VRMGGERGWGAGTCAGVEEDGRRGGAWFCLCMSEARVGGLGLGMSIHGWAGWFVGKSLVNFWDEATKRRRDGGTEGRRDGGTEGRRGVDKRGSEACGEGGVNLGA